MTRIGSSSISNAAFSENDAGTPTSPVSRSAGLSTQSALYSHAKDSKFGLQTVVFFPFRILSKLAKLALSGVGYIGEKLLIPFRILASLTAFYVKCVLKYFCFCFNYKEGEERLDWRDAKKTLEEVFKIVNLPQELRETESELKKAKEDTDQEKIKKAEESIERIKEKIKTAAKDVNKTLKTFSSPALERLKEHVGFVLAKQALAKKGAVVNRADQEKWYTEHQESIDFVHYFNWPSLDKNDKNFRIFEEAVKQFTKEIEAKISS